MKASLKTPSRADQFCICMAIYFFILLHLWFPYSFTLLDYIRINVSMIVHRFVEFVIITTLLYIGYTVPEISIDCIIGDDEIIRERTKVRTEIVPVKERFITREVVPHKGSLYSFFRTYCRYYRPSRLKAPGTRNYKFGSGNSPAIRTHNGMNIPRRSTLRSQFRPVTLKRS